MAGPKIVKILSSEYLIKGAANTAATVVIGSDTRNDATLTVNGNLTVLGTQTTINSVNTNIADNIITLNSGLAANVAPTLNAGVEVNRGNQPISALRWNETTDRWELSDGSGNFSPIATAQFGDFLTAVIEDPNPTLGGNLNTGSKTITSAINVTISPVGSTQVQSDLQLFENVPHKFPAVNPGWITFSGASAGGGDTGIYITNSKISDEELITKSKAIVYSLIF
jgi:hypothetical protein